VNCLRDWINQGQTSWEPLRMLSLAFLLSLFEACYVIIEQSSQNSPLTDFSVS
jgi:hypothetical protein